jgi:hypothetical protein
MFPKYYWERFHRKIDHHVSSREIVTQTCKKTFVPEHRHLGDLIRKVHRPTNQCHLHFFKLSFFKQSLIMKIIHHLQSFIKFKKRTGKQPLKG